MTFDNNQYMYTQTWVRKKDLITIMKIAKEVLNTNFIKIKFKNNVMRITELDKEHVIFVNTLCRLKRKVKSEFTVELNCDSLEQLQNISKKEVNIEFKKDGAEFYCGSVYIFSNYTNYKPLTLKVNYEDSNEIEYFISEFNNLLKCAKILGCKIMKLSNSYFEFSNSFPNITKQIRRFSLNDETKITKQISKFCFNNEQECEIFVNFEYLMKIMNIINRFKDRKLNFGIMSTNYIPFLIKFGVVNGKSMPLFLKLTDSYITVKIFIATYLFDDLNIVQNKLYDINYECNNKS
jgi:hypothetical protein